MLLSISLQDHQYEPIFGLNVDNSDQTIRDYLIFRLPPDRESIDLKSYYLTDYILRKIDDRRKEYEEYEKNIRSGQHNMKIFQMNKKSYSRKINISMV